MSENSTDKRMKVRQTKAEETVRKKKSDAKQNQQRTMGMTMLRTKTRGRHDSPLFRRSKHKMSTAQSKMTKNSEQSC